MKASFTRALTLWVLSPLLLSVATMQATPTPTPTPTPTRLKVKTIAVTTPTPTPARKRIKAVVITPTPRPKPISIIRKDQTIPTPTPKISVQEKKVPAETTATSPPKVLIRGKRTLDGTVTTQTVPPTPAPPSASDTNATSKRLIPGTKGIGENNLPPNPANNSTGSVAQPSKNYPPPAPPPLPDLICTNYSQTPNKNDGNDFRYEIKNIGTAYSGGTSDLIEFQFLDSSGKVIKTQRQYLEPMVPGKVVYTDFHVPSGYYYCAFRLVMDPDNKITESNEENNRSLAIWYGGFPTSEGFGK